MLSASDVTVRFGGITALDGVSLELAPGEVLGVIGPNGAGKTTLFNVICGFVTPAAGHLSWRGASLAGITPARLGELGIARTLQGVGLFEGLSTLENVMVGAERFRRSRLLGSLLGWPGGDRDERDLRRRGLAALAQLGCEDVADRRPHTLPFATQKKIGLARALASEPELLLLDEPAGGLGAEGLDELRALIETLRGSMAVMLVEHHMDLVMSVCDQVVVLDFGRVVAAGDAPTVQRDPVVLEAYLGRAASPAEAEGQAGASDARG